jgi:hypothetical protein
MISLLKVNKWWANELEEEEKIEIFFEYNPDALTDDYYEWWYFLSDIEKIEIYKEYHK